MESMYGSLSPLDPRTDPARYERLLRSVAAAASPELRRRAAMQDPLVLLTAWLRPAMAIAATIAAVALVAPRVLERSPEEAVVQVGVSDALGLPPAVGAWLEAGRTPTVEELVALNGVDHELGS